MQLDFDYTYKLEQGESPAATHMARENFFPFLIVDDKLAAIYSRVRYGKWGDLSSPKTLFSDEVVEDTPISELGVYRFSGDPSWITWHWDVEGQDEDKHRIMLIPGPNMRLRQSTLDEGEFGDPVLLYLDGDGEIIKVEQSVPFHQGEDSYGYIFRVKMESYGKFYFYEVGYDLGIKG